MFTEINQPESFVFEFWKYSVTPCEAFSMGIWVKNFIFRSASNRITQLFVNILRVQNCSNLQIVTSFLCDSSLYQSS